METEGGYIVAPAHNIQPDTPVDNVLAFFEAVKDILICNLNAFDLEAIDISRLCHLAKIVSWFYMTLFKYITKNRTNTIAVEDLAIIFQIAALTDLPVDEEGRYLLLTNRSAFITAIVALFLFVIMVFNFGWDYDANRIIFISHYPCFCINSP